jgi:hypothetical protein
LVHLQRSTAVSFCLINRCDSILKYQSSHCCDSNWCLHEANRSCLTQQAQVLTPWFHADRFIGSPRSTRTLIKQPALPSLQTLMYQESTHEDAARSTFPSKDVRFCAQRFNIGGSMKPAHRTRSMTISMTVLRTSES